MSDSEKPQPPADKFNRARDEGNACPECGGTHYGSNHCPYPAAPAPGAQGARDVWSWLEENYPARSMKLFDVPRAMEAYAAHVAGTLQEVPGTPYRCPACQMPLTGRPESHLPTCPVRGEDAACWVGVDERLPEKDGVYFVLYGPSEHKFASRFKGGKFNQFEVTRWLDGPPALPEGRE